MGKVLVVDDDPDVRLAVEEGLRVVGHDVRGASDGLAGLTAIAEWNPDVVVADVMMPVLDGLALCRRIRADGDRTAVLMLTALGSVGERIDGLDAGADDYLVKPFALGELNARVRALLRRTGPGAHPPGSSPDLLAFEDLELDISGRAGRRGSRSVDLTRTESALLEILMRNPGQVLTRETLARRVWGQDFGMASNSLAVYVGYLRRKLEADGEPRLVHTVHGIGYRLDVK